MAEYNPVHDMAEAWRRERVAARTAALAPFREYNEAHNIEPFIPEPYQRPRLEVSEFSVPDGAFLNPFEGIVERAKEMVTGAFARALGRGAVENA